MKKEGRTLGRKRQSRNTLTLLIICQGQKTEPNYFKAFKEKVKDHGIEIITKSTDPLNMVKYAQKIKSDKNKSGFREYSEIWVVFDKDQTEDDRFNQAINTAAKNRIHTAFSNTCFELWFLLHFEYMDNPINDNKDLFGKLTKHLNKKYQKTGEDIYQKIKKSEKKAINRAEKLESLHKNKCGNYADFNPCTTVHKLVKRLNEFS
jgi:hypothetical protein